MPEFLNVRIGPRFVFVTVLPNLVFALLIAGLLAAGAPADRPSWGRLEGRIGDLPAISLIVLSLAVVALGVAIHPLTLPLVQLLEGYWRDLPNGRDLQRLAAAAKARQRSYLSARLRAGATGDARADAQAALTWLPPAASPVLPTTLGNVLFAGEVRAGARYGYDTGVVWPRLHPLLGEDVRGQVADTRNQLDAAARLSVLGLLAVPITTALLISYDRWMLVPLGCYLFAWVSYRAAVAAAKSFCEALAVAFDHHHLALWDALALERPATLDDELRRGNLLSTHLRGLPPLAPKARRSLIYQRVQNGPEGGG